MQTIYARNVNVAYRAGLRLLKNHGVVSPSRAGNVLVMDTPVMTVYACPQERVLFDASRDANPFFHVMESVWMLAGSKDGTWLDRYVSNFSSRFAETGGDIHGAYGFRWRSHFDLEGGGDELLPDQILTVGKMLFEDFNTRRAVLTMWDPVADLGVNTKDMPCNTHVYFRGRMIDDGRRVLDITVCNRSNDAIWGAYGANAVHMSVMGEVVAGLAGVEIGLYYQMSNNFHAYTEVFDKIISKPIESVDDYATTTSLPIIVGDTPEARRNCALQILADAAKFIELRDISHVTRGQFETQWFNEVVLPMSRAHDLWKRGSREDAMDDVRWVRSPDWQRACLEWMGRRMKKAI